MSKHAIFLNGAVGAGKSTLGRALATRLAAGFIDGDDHSAHDRPWYGSILRTSRSIAGTGLALLESRSAVIVAYPLNRVGWIYFQRRFADAGVIPLVVTLRASYASIVDAGRGREFSAEEQARIKVMIAEGYDSRPFSDLIVDTDRAGFDATLDELEQRVRARMSR